MQTFSVGEAARMLNMGPKSLFRTLRDNRILDANNLPYRHYVDAGYFRVKLSVAPTEIGDRAYGQPRVTPRGLQYLERRFAGGAAS